MLPEPVIQLLGEIYADEDNEEILQKLRANPEELLISLLTEIKQDLPVVSATLKDTVQMAGAGVLESVKQREAAKIKELAKK